MNQSGSRHQSYRGAAGGPHQYAAPGGVQRQRSHDSSRPQGVDIAPYCPELSDPEALGSKADVLAKNLVANRLTTHQVRRFYGEIKSMERFLDASPNTAEAWKTLYPRIKLVRAKAYYAERRATNSIPIEFRDFLKHYIDKMPADPVQGVATFRSFCQLFEAVVGYSGQYTKNS